MFAVRCHAFSADTDGCEEMRIVIVGGHSRTALLLTGLLSRGGHAVVGTVRSRVQGNDVVAAGGTPLELDIATVSVRALAASLSGADAVVFAAGAGYGSTTLQKEAIDRDGAVLLADAAEEAGVSRYVLISSMGADYPDSGSDDPFQVYLRLKSEADANLRARALDWTIVRPSGLDDRPGLGRVRLGDRLGGGSIPRTDVAALIARLLSEGLGIRHQFEVASGPERIEDLSL
ncbi:SDR family oxidoreductase [Kitasatospora sp. NPDC057223]|uniref:SDR family oxidoreductase n=1 Tax=Kitasatospora sp. NPDC057223 TaxID=3346055 RepID=UPI003628623C